MVKNVSLPGNRILWIAALKGGAIVGPTGKIALVYKKEMRLTRNIWISKGFAENNSVIVKIVHSLSQRPGSKWKVVDNFDAFLALHTKLKEKKRPNELLGLATVAEIHDGCGEAQCFECICSQEQMLKKLAVLDLDLSIMGPG